MAAEIDDTKVAILRELDLVRLATISSKGDPFVIPVRFWYDGSSIYFTSDEGLPLLTNVRANRRVALVADTSQEGTPQGLVVQGLASIVRGQGEYDRVLEALSKKYSESSETMSGEIVVKVIPVRLLDLRGREL